MAGLQLVDYGTVKPLSLTDAIAQWQQIDANKQQQKLNEMKMQASQQEMDYANQMQPLKMREAEMGIQNKQHAAAVDIATTISNKMEQMGIDENHPNFQQTLEQISAPYRPVMATITGNPDSGQPMDWNAIKSLSGPTAKQKFNQELQFEIEKKKGLLPFEKEELAAKYGAQLEKAKEIADYEHTLKVQEKQQEAKQPKPLTESQANAKLYSSRMNKADQILSTIGSDYSPFAVSSAFSAEDSWVPGAGMAAYQMLSENDQKVMQAQRDFLNAVLRKESGASISPSEFSNAAKQYFDQPGESKEIRKQKAEARRLAIEEIQSALPGAAKQNDDFAAQFAKMPSGTVYTAPDGTVRRKR